MGGKCRSFHAVCAVWVVCTLWVRCGVEVLHACGCACVRERARLVWHDVCGRIFVTVQAFLMHASAIVYVLDLFSKSASHNC